jgi:hypothetical protein
MMKLFKSSLLLVFLIEVCHGNDGLDDEGFWKDIQFSQLFAQWTGHQIFRSVLIKFVPLIVPCVASLNRSLLYNIIVPAGVPPYLSCSNTHNPFVLS